MSSIREKLEDAIVETIGCKLAHSANPDSGYLAGVMAYNGDEGEEDFLYRFRGQSPFVLVSSAAGEYESIGVSRVKYRRQLGINIYVGSTHLRDRLSRVRSDAASCVDSKNDPGIYKILEDIHALLSGKDLALCPSGVSSLLPVSETPVIRSEGLTVWNLQYQVMIESDVTAQDFGDQDLSGYEIDINLSVSNEETAAEQPANPAVEANTTL
jgi:hypothetical protein